MGFGIFGLELLTAAVAFALGYQLAIGRKIKSSAVSVCPRCSGVVRGSGGKFTRRES